MRILDIISGWAECILASHSCNYLICKALNDTLAHRSHVQMIMALCDIRSASCIVTSIP